MNFSKHDMQATLKQFQLHPQDTASAQAQIALITYRLEYLKTHFNHNPKDHHSKMGLLKLVGKRKRLLAYLKRKDFENYKTLIGKLNIRK